MVCHERAIAPERRVSVQRYTVGNRAMWRVRWREPDGKMRSKSYPTKAQAEREDARIRAQKLLGHTPKAVQHRRTVAQAWDEWWQLEAPDRAEATRRSYSSLWRANIEPRLGGLLLADLVADSTPIYDMRRDMNARGVGRQSQRRTLVILTMLLNYCVGRGWIDENPASRVKKPPARPGERLPPFSPLVIERIRAEIADASQPPRSLADALLVGLLAYAGLRPQEALALRWSDVGRARLQVKRAAAFGEEKTTKTTAPRSVPLVAPLARDLADWRARATFARDGDYILPANDGGLWSDSGWRNWRARVWKPAVRRLAASDPDLDRLAAARPYDCRGSFVSLHLAAGTDPLVVAADAGHSPAVMWKHYAGVIEEFRDARERVPAELQIERAREALGTLPPEQVQEMVAAEVSGRSVLTQAMFAPRTLGRGA